MVVHNCLASYRDRECLSQSDLAFAVGVSKNTISAIERGEWFPSVKLALRLAFIFGVKVDDIFWLVEVTPDD